MCGICGVVGKIPNEELFTHATRTLAKRGPDATSCFFDYDSGVSLGHTRLRILDLDARSDQPMNSQSGRYYIVFNGEIYNFRELKKKYKNVFSHHKLTNFPCYLYINQNFVEVA